MSNHSEIARLMQQITLESQAMQDAMTGFSATAKHDIIAHRYAAIGQCRDQLASLVGDDHATDLMLESYSSALEPLPCEIGREVIE